MLNSDANKNTVYISHDDVRTVLDAMINPTTSWVNIESLSSLALVDRFLSNPDLPAFRNMSDLAIYEIIISIITDELLNHRRTLSLLLPSHKHTAKQYEHNITLDVQTNSAELLHWSLLYHCYVRVDLNISIERFAKLAMCTVRTVRRYRQYAVEQL